MFFGFLIFINPLSRFTDTCEALNQNYGCYKTVQSTNLPIQYSSDYLAPSTKYEFILNSIQDIINWFVKYDILESNIATNLFNRLNYVSQIKTNLNILKLNIHNNDPTFRWAAKTSNFILIKKVGTSFSIKFQRVYGYVSFYGHKQDKQAKFINSMIYIRDVKDYRPLTGDEILTVYQKVESLSAPQIQEALAYFK